MQRTQPLTSYKFELSVLISSSSIHLLNVKSSKFLNSLLLEIKMLHYNNHITGHRTSHLKVFFKMHFQISRKSCFKIPVDEFFLAGNLEDWRPGSL